MVRSKKRYFYVRAGAISRENFTKEAAYKKYSQMITDAEKNSSRGGCMVIAVRNTITYERNSYGELSSKGQTFKATTGKPIYFLADPHVMKYNGEWYFISGYPTYSGTTYIAKDIKFSANN